MPSIRKRIGYLPSVNIQEIITNIAKEEKLSQSKVVGILVEEALIARGAFDLHKKNHLIKKNIYRKETNMNNSAFKYSDLDELISDQGITYNTKKHIEKKDDFLGPTREEYNEHLLEQFKQFMIFQRMIKEKQ